MYPKRRRNSSDDEDYHPQARTVAIPSHNSDLAGPLGRAVLARYASKGKAKYDGKPLKRPTLDQLKETGKWDVYAKTGPKREDHEWVNLESTYNSKRSGRAIREVQMGHKLASAEWYQIGSKKYIDRRYTEIGNSRKDKGRTITQVEAKRDSMIKTFEQLKTPGKDLYPTVRGMINYAFNMRFEHYSYNSKHGGDGYTYKNKKIFK